MERTEYPLSSELQQSPPQPRVVHHGLEQPITEPSQGLPAPQQKPAHLQRAPPLYLGQPPQVLPAAPVPLVVAVVLPSQVQHRPADSLRSGNGQRLSGCRGLNGRGTGGGAALVTVLLPCMHDLTAAKQDAFPKPAVAWTPIATLTLYTRTGPSMPYHTARVHASSAIGQRPNP